MLAAGLAERLGARRAARVEPPAYDPVRDPGTGLLNPGGLVAYSAALADAVGGVLDRGEFPVVLGGDCSILLGNLLGLRRRGLRPGLLLLDGHANCWTPEDEPRGEAASMDLALATGQGPATLSNLEGHRPLARGEDVALVGRRDLDGDEEGPVPQPPPTVLDLHLGAARGAAAVAREAVAHLTRPGTIGFWVHLDADVLDDAAMPAVDHRMPGGLSWQELVTVLRAATGSGRALGLEVTILNPAPDPDGTVVRAFAGALAQGWGK